MGRTTISDIADVAGVSTATVDRALNGRSGVSAMNRHRVMKAARDLGYLPTDDMVTLPSRPARLEFLIPFGQNPFIHDVADSIAEYAETQPLVERCQIRSLGGFGPADLMPALDDVSLRTDGVGLFTIDHPKTRNAIRRLCEAGVKVVTLGSDILSTPRAAYVGVDDRVAGRTAGQIVGMLAAGRPGKIAVFFGSRSFHGHHERESGFRAVIGETCPNLTILPSVETNEDSDRVRTELSALLRVHDDLIGAYCVGNGAGGIVDILGVRGRPRPFVVMHDLTKASRSWLADDLIDAVIDQNARLVGEQAVIQLLGAIAAGETRLPVKSIEPRIILRENIPAGQIAS